MKQLSSSKFQYHGLTSDYDVLTSKGWKRISQVKTTDQIACLTNGKQLSYLNPTAIHHYTDYSGKMIVIENNHISLKVTPNYLMYVSRMNEHLQNQPFKLVSASEIYQENVRYLKNAEIINNLSNETIFCLPNSSQPIPIHDWLNFYSVWLIYGSIDDSDGIIIDIAEIPVIVRHNVFESLKCLQTALGHFILPIDENQSQCESDLLYNFYCKQLHEYLETENHYSLGDWVWSLSKLESQVLITQILLYVNKRPSIFLSLIDSLQRLAVHSGWSLDFSGRNLELNKFDSNNQPMSNQLDGVDQIVDYQGSVYCLTVPGDAFYVRRNGKGVWVGSNTN